MALGSWFSALGSSLLDFIGNIGSAWGTNSAKESLNKNVTKTTLKYQQQYDKWALGQTKDYEKWWQDYLYKLQSNQYFKLAQKYAENTASWAVRGLEKAGLNPILAGIDSNLSSSMGNAQPQQSGKSVGGGTVRGASVSTSVPSISHVAQNLQANSAARQADATADVTQVDKEVRQATKYADMERGITAADMAHAQLAGQYGTNRQIEAHTAQIEADSEVKRAEALKTAVDTANAAKNSGLNGLMGGVIRLAHEISTPSDNDTFGHMVERAVGVHGDAQNTARSPLVHVRGEGATPWYHVPVEDIRYGRKPSVSSRTMDKTDEIIKRTRQRLRRK